MNVAVYALTGNAGSRVAGRGVSGERLRVVRVGAVAAIVGDVARIPAPTEAKLRAYTTLLAALATTRQSLLPVRFGTAMQDEELETILRARQKTLTSQLARVRGRMQMTVRIITEGAGGGGQRAGGRGQGEGKRVVSGSDYLASRAREHSASALPGFAPLNRAVARWVRDERVERRGTVATVYHLIPRAAAGRYAAAIEAAAAAEGVRLLVSGPWPPHAFGDW
jgi:hypothetical protein